MKINSLNEQDPLPPIMGKAESALLRAEREARGKAFVDAVTAGAERLRGMYASKMEVHDAWGAAAEASTAMNEALQGQVVEAKRAPGSWARSMMALANDSARLRGEMAHEEATRAWFTHDAKGRRYFEEIDRDYLRGDVKIGVDMGRPGGDETVMAIASWLPRSNGKANAMREQQKNDEMRRMLDAMPIAPVPPACLSKHDVQELLDWVVREANRLTGVPHRCMVPCQPGGKIVIEPKPEPPKRPRPKGYW